MMSLCFWPLRRLRVTAVGVQWKGGCCLTSLLEHIDTALDAAAVIRVQAIRHNGIDALQQFVRGFGATVIYGADRSIDTKRFGTNFALVYFCRGFVNKGLLPQERLDVIVCSTDDYCYLITACNLINLHVQAEYESFYHNF